MKTLIIDSHKSNNKDDQQNLHWLNGKILANYFGADYIWSYPSVNDVISTNYEVIMFNHASRYSYESENWLYDSPDARIFYVCNDYNLGEPITLWKWAKTNNKQYQVIANHDRNSSAKITKKWVSEWHNVNLNSLIFAPVVFDESDLFFDNDKRNCIYYGSFRKDRTTGFQKYLKSNIILSTHKTNISDFKKIGCSSHVCKRIVWHPEGYGLSDYKFSLCIEDDTTYNNYSRLANRFYEALNYDVIPIFDINSKNNVKLSGYNIPEICFVDGYDDLMTKIKQLDKIDFTQLMKEWKTQAASEKQETLEQIKNIIS